MEKLGNLDQDALLGSFQHGFRKNHSTVTAVADIIESIGDLSDQKKQIAIYSADLTAAFDVLQKEKLVEIMLRNGVPKYLVAIIHNYLSDRYGYVEVGNSRSRVRKIRAGCIQGSVLGPILFCIYTNELDKIVSPHRVTAYADDAYIVVSAENPVQLKLETEATIINHFNWLTSIGMICNLAKTELVKIGPGELSVNINGLILNSAQQMKSLGMIIDCNLTWSSHVEAQISKCRSYLYALRYLRKHLNLKDTIKIFQSHIVSILTYGSPVWSHRINYKTREKLKSFYYHTLRVLVRDFNFTLNRVGLLKATLMEDINIILTKRVSMFLVKILKNLTPTTLAGIMISKSYENERNLGRLTFFDCSNCKISKSAISNAAKAIVEKWRFDWVYLSVDEFKARLQAQFQTKI